MNLFRSEEHLRNWSGYRNDKGKIPVAELMRLFSGDFFTKRLDPDYFSHMGEYMSQMLPALDTLQGAGSHWSMAWYEKSGMSLAQRLGLL